MFHDHPARCVFARVVSAILSLIILAGAIVGLLFPGAAATWLGQLAVAEAGLAASAFPATDALSVALVVVGLIALAIFLIDVWPASRRRTLVVPFEAGSVEYPLGILASTIAQGLMSLDGVQEARVEVSGQRKRVDTMIRLWLTDEPHAQVVMTQIANAVREKLSSLGLEAGTVRVAIQDTPLARPTNVQPAA